MSISGGSGVGGNIGGLQQPTPEEINKTAWTEVNKASLMIVKGDTFEVIPFTQTGGANLWKYLSKESSPTLDMPLFLLRASAPSVEAKEEGAKSAIYEELLKGLPENIALWLKEQAKLPLEMRNNDFAPIQALLLLATSGLSVIYGQPLETPISEEAASLYEGLPVSTLKGATLSGDEVMQRSDQLLSYFNNSPHFDDLTLCSTHLKAVLNDLSLMLSTLKGRNGS